MVASAHVHERLIRAPRAEVWRALTEPDLTERYFFGTRIESSFRPGEKYRYVDGDDVDVIDGDLETVDAPNRLVMTFRMLRADEPPSRVEWMLADADEAGHVTRLTLRHGELALSPGTWEEVRGGWVTILDSLKTLIETGTPMPAVRADATPEPGATEANWHRAQAVIANNSVWELLDEREYTSDDTDELLQRAYAAAYHWHRAAGATTINQARASWLVSRAHATLGQGELALHHAVQCATALTRAGNDAADFDHAYVYEARARALACLGRLDEAREAYRRACRVPIADDQDRAIAESDLAAGPWFGLDRDVPLQ